MRQEYINMYEFLFCIFMYEFLDSILIGFTPYEKAPANEGRGMVFR